MSRITVLILLAIGSLFAASTAVAQQGLASAKITGTVSLQPSSVPARNAVVTIIELKRAVLTDEHGDFSFEAVPAGKYQISAHLDRVPDVVRAIEVTNNNQTVDFQLTLAAVSEQVIVTASGSAEALGSSYQPVTAVSGLELSQKNAVSIGEALEYQTGIAKRSFGPGSGRPIIRGFDGDRVLILQDGMRIGGIASQSADEVEPIDVLNLDRVEIVKGPATLLYGSNAIGGVVNGVSSNEVYQRGLSGYVNTFGASNNDAFGGSAGFKFGVNNFLFFGNGTAQRASDYKSAAGTVLNSFARNGDVSGGMGWFPRAGWLVFNYAYDRRRHGIPVEPDELDLESLRERRHSLEVRSGFRKAGSLIEGGDFAVRYNNYKAREFEFETDEDKTELESIATNKNFNYRANFNHRRMGAFAGTIGFSGFSRDFLSVGKEAPAPHTKQNSFAAYILERADFERAGFQFGARVEQNGYNPEGNFRDRNFIGFSASAGARFLLWHGGSFVANYQHSFRAPALEELYNNGPHPGIRTFDIGNQNLNAEQGDGIDLTLRHSTQRLRLETSGYYYNIRNFVFTNFTGLTDPGTNLPIIRYDQGRSRFAGIESSVEVKAASTLWVNAKMDYVRAELVSLNKPLPRIPPLRGTLGLDWRYRALNVRPAVILVNAQGRVFDNETPTAGYGIVNVTGSYTFVTHRVAHIVAVTGWNLTDKLYRNHLSFSKEIAPEMGRAVRLSYMLRF